MKQPEDNVLGHKDVELKPKHIYIDVKENDKGRYLNIAEVGISIA